MCRIICIRKDCKMALLQMSCVEEAAEALIVSVYMHRVF